MEERRSFLSLNYKKILVFASTLGLQESGSKIGS
jgi:hypothetical protein